VRATVVGLGTMVPEGLVLLTSVVFAVAVFPRTTAKPKARGGGTPVTRRGHR